MFSFNTIQLIPFLLNCSHVQFVCVSSTGWNFTKRDIPLRIELVNYSCLKMFEILHWTFGVKASFHSLVNNVHIVCENVLNFPKIVSILLNAWFYLACTARCHKWKMIFCTSDAKWLDLKMLQNGRWIQPKKIELWTKNNLIIFCAHMILCGYSPCPCSRASYLKFAQCFE